VEVTAGDIAGGIPDSTSRNPLALACLRIFPVETAHVIGSCVLTVNGQYVYTLSEKGRTFASRFSCGRPVEPGLFDIDRVDREKYRRPIRAGDGTTRKFLRGVPHKHMPNPWVLLTAPCICGNSSRAEIHKPRAGWILTRAWLNELYGAVTPFLLDTISDEGPRDSTPEKKPATSAFAKDAIPEHPAGIMNHAAMYLWAHAGTGEEDTPAEASSVPHPGISIAVADWLAVTAARSEKLLLLSETRDGTLAWTCRLCSGWINDLAPCNCGWRDAIKVARAVLDTAETNDSLRTENQ